MSQPTYKLTHEQLDGYCNAAVAAELRRIKRWMRAHLVAHYGSNRGIDLELTRRIKLLTKGKTK